MKESTSSWLDSLGEKARLSLLGHAALRKLGIPTNVPPKVALGLMAEELMPNWARKRAYHCHVCRQEAMLSPGEDTQHWVFDGILSGYGCSGRYELVVREVTCHS